MNKIRSDFPTNIKNFFINLQNYVDEDLYFYGSVNRPDYVHGKSDIDVAIFTDNEYSLMTKLQHFLHVKKSDFEPIVWIIDDKDITYGYKIKYEHPESKLIAEFSIYNEKFKNVNIKEHNSKNVLPFYILIMLYILKSFYYTIPLLPKKLYASCKRFILSVCLGKGYSKFIVLKNI